MKSLHGLWTLFEPACRDQYAGWYTAELWDSWRTHEGRCRGTGMRASQLGTLTSCPTQSCSGTEYTDQSTSQRVLAAPQEPGVQRLRQTSHGVLGQMDPERQTMQWADQWGQGPLTYTECKRALIHTQEIKFSLTAVSSDLPKLPNIKGNRPLSCSPACLTALFSHLFFLLLAPQNLSKTSL